MMVSVVPVQAALTPAQRKELSRVNRDIKRLSALIRRKKFDEADKSLSEIAEKVAKLAKDNDKDRAILLMQRQVDIQRSLLDRAKSGKKGRPVKGTGPAISFTKQIAPILKNRCGTCHACLDVCPTDAFPAPYRLDARRCLSYLTIEHKGHIAREFRVAMGNRIYGCDDCLAVCPWNKYAQASRETAFHARAELTAPRLIDLAGLDDAAFRELFRRSPIKRTGRDRFVRNVLIALGNSGDPAAASAAETLLDDESPLVRAMAVWALVQLLPPPEFAKLKAARSPDESDTAVAAEWENAVR